MEYLKYNPVALYRLDDESPFVDISGRGREGFAATESKGITLSRFTNYSQIFNNSNVASFETPVFVAGKESQEFTLMASINIISRTGYGKQQILSNLGKYDGLWIDNGTIFFSTNYTSGPPAICSYKVENYSKFDVAGVHREESNSLYINGELVSEVQISPEQRLELFDAPDDLLYSGEGDLGQDIMMNMIATYATALNSEFIKSIYDENTKISEFDVGEVMNGEVINLYNAYPLINAVYDTDESWSTDSTCFNCSVMDDSVRSQIVDGQTVVSEWSTSIPLVLNSISFASVDWTGENVTLEASINLGSSWFTLTNKTNISQLQSLTSTPPILMIRAKFPAGLSEAYLEYLNIKIYETNIYQSNSRQITLTQPVNVKSPGELTILSESNGVKILGGKIIVGQDSSSVPSNIRTIEMVVQGQPSINSTITKTYVNGEEGVMKDAGEWYLLHLTTPSISGSLEISGNIQILKLTLYPYVMTADDIEKSYRLYFNEESVQIDSNDELTLLPSEDFAQAYAYDWQSISAV